MSENQPKEYELATIADIFDKIPGDRLALCMAEITELIAQAMQHRAAGTVKRILLPILWIDDGKGEIIIRISSQPQAGDEEG